MRHYIDKEPIRKKTKQLREDLKFSGFSNLSVTCCLQGSMKGSITIKSKKTYELNKEERGKIIPLLLGQGFTGFIRKKLEVEDRDCTLCITHPAFIYTKQKSGW